MGMNLTALQQFASGLVRFGLVLFDAVLLLSCLNADYIHLYKSVLFVVCRNIGLSSFRIISIVCTGTKKRCLLSYEHRAYTCMEVRLSFWANQTGAYIMGDNAKNRCVHRLDFLMLKCRSIRDIRVERTHEFQWNDTVQPIKYQRRLVQSKFSLNFKCCSLQLRFCGKWSWFFKDFYFSSFISSLWQFSLKMRINWFYEYHSMLMLLCLNEIYHHFNAIWLNLFGCCKRCSSILVAFIPHQTAH